MRVPAILASDPCFALLSRICIVWIHRRENQPRNLKPFVPLRTSNQKTYNNMNRISKKLLQSRVETINCVLGMPDSPYTRTEDKFTANIGNFHLSQAYGGYCVHRMCNENGGVSTPIWSGHIPAREAYERICAFIAGLTFTK